MTYRFVQAAVDDGPAAGPRLAFVIHMAEGGGTVGFLSRPNRDGVSVHFVIEYDGEIVQMLETSHMHTSLRPSAIRMTDDADGFFGRTAAVAVMGVWADTAKTLGPNHASLAVEIEGFAAQGPNPKQTAALEDLVADMRSRYPRIGLLGHRDFQSYKACPGRLIDWTGLGGHAIKEGDVRFISVIEGKVLHVAKGYPWKFLDGSAGGAFSDAATIAIEGRIDGHTTQYVGRIGTSKPYQDGVSRPTLVLIETTSALSPAPAPPAADCSQAIADGKAAQHEVDRARAVELAGQL